MLHNTYKAKQYLIPLLKWSITLVALYAIYVKIQQEASTFTAIKELKINTIVILGIASLTVLNITFEIWRWKIIAKEVTPIGFPEAAKQTLASQTLSLITPARLGEYGAKPMFFHKSKTKDVVLLTLYHNMHQMAITLLMGLLGLCILGWYSVAVSIALIGISVILISILLKNVKIKSFHFNQLWHYYQSLTIKSRVINLTLAWLRYFTFTYQFYILLTVMHLLKKPYVEVLPYIAAMYVLSSLVPVSGLFDIAVRAGVAVWLFNNVTEVSSLVAPVTLIMWISNVALPAVIGIVYIIGFKVKT